MVKTRVSKVRSVDSIHPQWKSKRMLATYMLRTRNNNLARVPRKPISANRGLNLANRGIHFVPRLDTVPESMINLNLGIN